MSLAVCMNEASSSLIGARNQNDVLPVGHEQPRLVIAIFCV